MSPILKIQVGRQRPNVVKKGPPCADFFAQELVGLVGDFQKGVQAEGELVHGDQKGRMKELR